MICWNTWDRSQEKCSFSCSWNKRPLPEVWNTAHLVPVLKKGKDKTNPSSYHPISLLSCVGKLMQRVITRRLSWFLETNNVFSPSQTGYRQHRSTEDQFALLTQDIENSFQEKRKLQRHSTGVEKKDCCGNCWEQEFQVKCTNGSAAFFTTEWPEWSLVGRSAERSD